MPRFNKEKYITDNSYVIHISEISSATKKNLAQLTENLGIVWDEDAIAIPVHSDEDVSTKGWMDEGEVYYSPGEKFRRSIMVEGSTVDGKEVVYIRRETMSEGAGQTNVWIDGVKYNKSALLRLSRNLGTLEDQIESLRTRFSPEQEELAYRFYNLEEQGMEDTIRDRFDRGRKAVVPKIRTLERMKDLITESKPGPSWHSVMDQWAKSATAEAREREASRRRGGAGPKSDRWYGIPVEGSVLKSKSDLDWS